MISSSELALTGTYPPSDFTSFDALEKMITEKATRLSRNDSDESQYIALKNVSRGDFDQIETKRAELGSRFRLTYFPDIGALIIKVPTREHEVAHQSFGMEASIKVRSMGMGPHEFLRLGATKYTGPTASSKECDASFINMILRGKNAWPNLVIEAGVSESVRRLHGDADWWFTNSNGAVNLVILIKVHKQRKEIVIEKYDRFLGLATRSTPATWKKRLLTSVTLKCQTRPARIEVKGPNTPAAPVALTLEFSLVFGRQATGHEHDIRFTRDELITWSVGVFG